MCDTLCAPVDGGMLFAKNSDRPEAEVQLIEALVPRPAGGAIRTGHLSLPDVGAVPVLASRPSWMWGVEHGVNAHGVAAGNEKLWTADDPRKAPDALTGMDLVRLCLERAETAAHGVQIIASLIERHGQGGQCDEAGDRYFSSFLVADPVDSWVVETTGRSWVASRRPGPVAISNRLTLGTDWCLGSVPAGTDVTASWAHPSAPTGHADRRLAATRAALQQPVDPAALARLLRDHGDGAGAGSPPPRGQTVEGDGVTVCMHVGGSLATAAGMIALLPSDGSAPRAWVAPGSPCVSVFVPVLAPQAVPECLGDPAVPQRVRNLARRIESEPSALPEVRTVLDPLEADLWEEAERAGTSETRWRTLCASVGVRLTRALDRLGA